MEPGATDLWAYRGVWGIAIRGVQARSVVSRLVRLRAIKKGQNLDYLSACLIKCSSGH